RVLARPDGCQPAVPRGVELPDRDPGPLPVRPVVVSRRGRPRRLRLQRVQGDRKRPRAAEPGRRRPGVLTAGEPEERRPVGDIYTQAWYDEVRDAINSRVADLDDVPAGSWHVAVDVVGDGRSPYVPADEERHFLVRIEDGMCTWYRELDGEDAA